MRRDINKKPFTKAERVAMGQALQEIVAQAIYVSELVESGEDIAENNLNYLSDNLSVLWRIVSPAPVLDNVQMGRFWDSLDEQMPAMVEAFGSLPSKK